MRPTKPMRELMAAANKALRANREFRVQLELKNQLEMARLSRVGERFRERMLRRALMTAGIEYGLIEKQHARNNIVLKRFVKQQKRSAVAHGRSVLRQRSGALAAAKAGLLSDQLLHPSRTKVRLDRVIATQDIGHKSSAATISWNASSPAPEQNLLRGVVRAQSSWNANEHANMFLISHFAWDSDREGIVIAASQVWPSLNWAIRLESACVARCSAFVKIYTQLQITQYDSNGKLQLSIAPETYYVDRSLEGTYFDGAVALAGETDPIPLSSWSPIPLANGRPVLVSVAVGINVCAFNAQAEVEFEGGGLRINVPFVDLHLFD